MPIFPSGYNQKATPVDNDYVMIADSAAANAIKWTRLSAIITKATAAAVAAVQALTDWITPAMIKAAAVTFAKLDRSTFPPAMTRTFGGEQGTNVGALKVVTMDLEANVTYLVLSSIQWTSSGGGGIKLMSLRVNGTTLDDHRIESSTQEPMSHSGFFRPTTSGTYTFDIYISNVTGGANATLGITRFQAIPLPTTQAIA